MENKDIATVVGILKKIPLFEQLDENGHQEIVKRITLEYFPENHLIFKEGEKGDNLYIIKNGLVRIYHAGDTPSFDELIATLGPNDFFGEMALISDNPRFANAKVIEPAQVFKLNKNDLMQLISENSDFASKISHEYLHRFKTNLKSDQPKI